MSASALSVGWHPLGWHFQHVQHFQHVLFSSALPALKTPGAKSRGRIIGNQKENISQFKGQFYQNFQKHVIKIMSLLYLLLIINTGVLDNLRINKSFTYYMISKIKAVTLFAWMRGANFMVCSRYGSDANQSACQI